jgi:hypothetical protein
MSTLVEIASVPKDRIRTVRVALWMTDRGAYVDLRVMIPGAGGTALPSKRGVTVALSKLPWIIDALQKTEREARKRGLIHDGSRAAA